MLDRKASWKASTLFSLTALPLSRAICLSTSIILAMSTSLGQRVMQVSQEAQSQMVELPRTWSFLPIWIILMTLFGLYSITNAMGQPAVHFRQW